VKPPEHLELLAWCSGAGALLVGLLALLDRHKGRTRPASIALGLSMALAGTAVWIQTHGFYFSLTRDVHVHDQFHYVLASKYFRELGYQHLYPAAIVAAEESGRRLPMSEFREMEHYEMVPVAEVRQDSTRYRALFSASRWQEFKSDVAAFRRWIQSGPDPQDSLRGLFMDRGYSGTPAWTWVGGQVSGRFPVNPRTLWAFSQLDVALLVVAFALIGRTFGLWGLTLSLLFWGSSYLSYYMVTGGAFLRYGWYAALIAGICALVANRNGLAGAMIGYSAAMRVFPGLLAIPVGALALIEWMQGRRGDVPAVRFLAGFALVLALMVGISAFQYGATSWVAFSEKILTHTEHFRMRSVGLDYVFAYQSEKETKSELRTLGIEGYKSRKLDLMRERKPWIRVVQLLFGIGLAMVLIRRQVDLLGVAILGCSMLPILVSPTTYYYAFMIVPLLAFCRAWPRPYAAFGILWLLLEALLGYLLELQQTILFSRQFLISISVTCFSAYLIATVGWAYPPRSSLRRAAPGHSSSEESTAPSV